MVFPRVSIIIPVYNVEKYLDRCLNSVVNQSYKNLEIILVDDGSTDSSPVLCENWAKSDDRIKVFHKNNGGLSDARNYGVSRSTGDYIFFVDSDDCIHYKTIEHLYNAIKAYDAEISCCNYFKFSSDNELGFKEDGTVVVADGGEQACRLSMTSKTFMIPAWGKMIKTEIVKNNTYPIGRFQEDEATTFKYYYQSRKTVVLDKRLYGYYCNANGIMKSPENKKKNVLDLLEALNEQLAFYNLKKEEELYQLAYTRYVRCYLEAYRHGFVVSNRKELKRIIRSDLKNDKENRRFKLFLVSVLAFNKLALSMKYKK